jgi:class 3 adenylate cyclase
VCEILQKGPPKKFSIGDSVMAAFRSVEAALDYARSLQADPGEPRLQVRAGIHIGPMSVDEADLFGGTVNLAARVTHEITGAEIWISDDAKKHLMLRRAPHHRELKWYEHKDIALKGFSDTHSLWSLSEPSNSAQLS